MSATTSPIEPAGLLPEPTSRGQALSATIVHRAPASLKRLGPALLAIALAAMVAALHWKGVDQAAQAYRVAQVRDHGLALWDSGWYGGNYPLGYSLVFPVIGAIVGLTAAGAAAAAGASWAFDRLVTTHLGRRPIGVWYFAASTILPVAIGQLPYLAGEALGLAALVALTAERRRTAVLLAVLAASCSPLAAGFLVLACAAWFWYRRGHRMGIGVVAGASVVVVGGLGLAFPGTGPFPFPWGALLIVLLACAVPATSLVRSTPVIRLAAALYALSCVASFMVANPLGGNAPRLAASVGIPLLICLATAAPSAPLTRTTVLPARADPGRWLSGRHGRTVMTVGALGALAVWQWGPGLGVVTSPASDPAIAQSYYQPLVRQVLARSSGPTRLEIPPTKEHWEAAWVAPYVSLARGWERQLDIADNPIFYQPGILDPTSYRHWLLANGVTWVALPATPLDYAGVNEGDLLRTGEVKGLHLVWSNRDWKLWRVTGSPGLVSGPAKLSRLAPDQVDLSVTKPGQVTLRVRYSSFASVQQGDACIRPDGVGWTAVEAASAGPVVLGSSVLPHGDSGCPAP